MMVSTKTISINTKGFADIINLTTQVEGALQELKLKNGIVNVFVPGSTAGITTIEFESGAIEDLKNTIERLIPDNIHYQHDARWGDGNGFSHVRSALLGPSLVVPFTEGRLLLGTWQQIVFVDFDNRPRYRDINLSIYSRLGKYIPYPH